MLKLRLRKSVKVISIDPGWRETSKRNAVVVATPSGRIDYVASGLSDEGLKSLVKERAEPRSFILLDVPVERCDISGHWRPVEKALQHYLSLYPISMAGKRGPELKRSLLEALPSTLRSGVSVQEIYPHAVYKFLWAAKQKGKLESVTQGIWERILDESFRREYPPRYKGQFTRDQRLCGLRRLYDFLTGLGLDFTERLACPGDELSGRVMDRLSDEYDACLGAVAGLYYSNGNPYARVVGEREQGDILLLADVWLAGELRKRGMNVV
ncbi:MAG: hypothetical protein ACLFPU_07405 [Dehalococcoidia bacterium]